jgi:hypothetical protein
MSLLFNRDKITSDENGVSLILAWIGSKMSSNQHASKPQSFPGPRSELSCPAVHLPVTAHCLMGPETLPSILWQSVL